MCFFKIILSTLTLIPAFGAAPSPPEKRSGDIMILTRTEHGDEPLSWKGFAYYQAARPHI